MINPAREWRDGFDTFGVNASVVAPLAGTVIADSGAIPAGFYTVTVGGSYGGTADVIDNMRVTVGGRKGMVLPVVPVANSEPIFITLPAVRILEGEHVLVSNIAAGAAGSVFRGTIIVTPTKLVEIGG